MRDFWAFKDEKDLKRNVADFPDSILKEQCALLTQKTNYVLYGKMTNYKINDDDKDDIGVELASQFDICVPKLDNYSTTLLIMYSHPESEYPISITVGNGYIEDLEEFNPKYSCKTQEEFENAIKKILSSQEVTNKVMILYSKATII